MFWKFLLISIAALAITACKEDENPPETKFEGITVTAENGSVINVDTNDWRATNLLRDILVYPNPIMPIDSATLVFSLQQYAQCKVWIVDNYSFSKTILDNALVAGTHAVTIKGLTNERIYRLYIQAGKEKTYGDIWVRYPED